MVYYCMARRPVRHAPDAPSPSGKAEDFDSSIAGFDVITIIFRSIKCGDSYFVGRFLFVVLLVQ